MKYTIAIISFLLLFLVIDNVNAQCAKGMTQKRVPGQIDLSLGYGMVSPNFRFGANPEGIPLKASIDYAFTSSFSGGIFIGYGQFNTQQIKGIPSEDSGIPELKHGYIATGLRLMGHYTKIPKVDLYGGASLYYLFHKSVDFKEDLVFYQITNNSNREIFLMSGIVGGRYSLNKNISLNLEINPGASVGSVGITFSLNKV